MCGWTKVLVLYLSNHKTLNNFAVNSPGGDAREAMKIGRLFRKYLITVEAPLRMGETGAFLLGSDGGNNLCGNHEVCICASACALVWFGAVNRFGAVGLHRPSIADPEFKAMAPAEASTTYRRGLDEVSRYLEEMEAPRPMIDAMVATSSSEIQWVDSQRDGIQRPPSIAEWSDASCGPFTKEEESTFLDLMGKRPRLSSNETMLYDMLSNKENAKAACEAALYSSHRDQLAAPGLFDDLLPEPDRSRVDQLPHP